MASPVDGKIGGEGKKKKQRCGGGRGHFQPREEETKQGMREGNEGVEGKRRCGGEKKVGGTFASFP